MTTLYSEYLINQKDNQKVTVSDRERTDKIVTVIEKIWKL